MGWRENRIKAVIEGKNPMLIKELTGGYAVFGDVQFLPGYCVLLPKREAFSLNDLTLEERTNFLLDMSLLGDAILASIDAIRMNYDILGNTDAYLHAHVFPRYDWEVLERKKMPVWLYDKSNWSNEATAYMPKKHDVLRNQILSKLNDYEKR